MLIFLVFVIFFYIWLFKKSTYLSVSTEEIYNDWQVTPIVTLLENCAGYETNKRLLNDEFYLTASPQIFRSLASWEQLALS